MAYSIQPIETIYNGYRFRSRLEARWAVFFDAGRIKYEYEPNGYNLNGINYLPDFYLPDFDLFVEIKPFDKDVVRHVGDGNKWEKICSNFRNITGRAILLCYGYPHEGLNKMLYAHDLCDSGGDDFLGSLACNHYRCIDNSYLIVGSHHLYLGNG